MIHGLWTDAVEDRIWQDIFCVRVHDSIDVGVCFHDRRMDVALCVTTYCAVHRRAVCDVVFTNV